MAFYEYANSVDRLIVNRKTKSELPFPAGMEFHLLDREFDRWELARYSTPRDEEKARNLLAELRQPFPTVAYVNGSSVTAIWGFKGDTQVPWLQFPSLELREGPKPMKRLTVLGWQEFLALPREFDLSIKYDDTFDERVNDGMIYVHPRVRDRMIDSLECRLLDQGMAGDKADRILTRMTANNNWLLRLITPDGMVKGGAIISPHLEADFVTHSTNLTGELATTDGSMFVTMFPEEQGTATRTDPQKIAAFYPAVFEGTIEEAFSAEVDEQIDEHRRGVLPAFIAKASNVDDSMRNMQQRVLKWTDEYCLGIRDSLYLTQMMAGQRQKTMESPKMLEKPWKRSFPIPGARRYSIRSVQDAEFANKKASVCDDEALIIPDLGAVFTDKTYKVVADILGGGDKDDHVDMMPFVVASDAELPIIGKVEAGEHVYLISRSPIGILADGEKLAVEYVVLRIAGKHKVPEYEIELNLLPTSVLEPMADFEPKFVAEPMDEPNYGKLFSKVLVAAGEAGFQYSMHAIMMGEALRLSWEHDIDIPLTPYAREEEFVDACQQYFNPETIKMIEQANKRHFAELWKHARPLEMATMKRLKTFLSRMKFSPTEDFAEMTVSHLVKHHRSEVDRFIASAQEDLTNLVYELEAKHYATPVTWNVKGVPLLLVRWNEMKEERRRMMRRRLTYHDFNAIGDELAEKMEQAVGKDGAKKAVLEALAYSYKHVKITTRYPREVGQYTHNTDAPLFNGALLDLLAEALK